MFRTVLVMIANKFKGSSLGIKLIKYIKFNYPTLFSYGKKMVAAPKETIILSNVDTIYTEAFSQQINSKIQYYSA